jgi:hypothetical protein
MKINNINNIKSTTIPWGHNTPPQHEKKADTV